MSVVYIYGTAGLSGEAMLLHGSGVVVCARSKLLLKYLAGYFNHKFKISSINFNSGFKGLNKTNTNSARKLFQLRI